MPAVTSPALAANEECLGQRGGKHCCNSLSSDVTNTSQIFTLFLFIILPFFNLLKFLKIFESQHHFCLSLSTEKRV